MSSNRRLTMPGGLQWAQRWLGEQAADVYGVVLCGLGLLTAVGVYTGGGGAAGPLLQSVALGLFGVYGYLLPPILVAGGLRLALLDNPGVSLRTAACTAAVAVSTLSAWHLAAGAPTPAQGVAATYLGGGLVGHHLSSAAVALLGSTGAWIGLGMAGTIGLLLGTGLRLPTITSPTRRATKTSTAKAKTKRSRTDTADGDGKSGRNDSAAAKVKAAAKAAAKATSRTGDTDTTDQPTPAADDASTVQAAPAKPSSRRRRSGYTLPSVSMLSKSPKRNTNPAGSKARAARLQQTLADHQVDATVVRHSRGPTVTMFEIELGTGVKVGAVTKLHNDIAYALACDSIRIVAPIPGKSAIGVEVPNDDRDPVTLGDVLGSSDARDDDHPLRMAVGVDIDGNAVLANLAKMPHLLVAGATGSGKSVALNAMVCSMLMRATPDQVRLLLVDPKRVELGMYADAPHLLIPPVTEPAKAVAALQWAVGEMDRRYAALSALGHRNIDEYAAARDAGTLPDPATVTGDLAAVTTTDEETGQVSFTALPYLVVVVDELADLMMQASKEVEEAITRLAQMARAVGIHLILCTQRPDAKTLTGLIRSNVPSRLSLSVMTASDSRIVLDTGGAEQLVGNGDLLFLPAGTPKPMRLQGPWVAAEELHAIIGACAAQQPARHDEAVMEALEGMSPAPAAADPLAPPSTVDEDLKEVYEQAVELVRDAGLGSTSMLQRRLRIGYGKASRLLDIMEARGIVGPPNGTKARSVLSSGD